MRLINKDRELKLRNKADSASTIIIYTLGVLEPDQTCGHISQRMRLTIPNLINRSKNYCCTQQNTIWVLNAKDSAYNF